jgi:large subunit ribosomal protein L15
MANLHNLEALVQKRKRVGRGGSRGGTSGKGGKGQTQRSGGFIRIGFEGGQMPLFRRLPKRGFNNYEFQKEIRIVNLADLERVFESGDVVNKESLLEKGLIKSKKSISGGNQNLVIKILGDGDLSKKLTVIADSFSEKASQVIKECGGEARLSKEM